MKTIKIIDLYNKIANGEELPKKIKYNNIIFSIRKDMEDYVSEDESWFTDCFSLLDLNDEVEIIEDLPKHFGKEENQAVKNIIKKNSVPIKENYLDYYEDTPKEETQVLSRWSPPKEDKKIEKLDYCEENTFMKQKETTYLSQKERLLLDSNFKTIKEKFDEIIDKVNGE